jgi:hypothetical protein
MFGVAKAAGAASAELTKTLTWFELTVAGTKKLSVTLSLKLHVPIAVDVVVEKM